MSETNGNTPTSASMRGGACSPLSGGDGGYGGQSLPGAPALMHGDVREAVNAANRDEAEKTYGEDSVRVLRVVLPGAPTYILISVSTPAVTPPAAVSIGVTRECADSWCGNRSSRVTFNTPAWHAA